MSILGIRVGGENKRKVAVSLDLGLAQLVRQVARLEKKSVTQFVSDMLDHYVSTVHPEWDVVTDRKQSSRKGAK